MKTPNAWSNTCAVLLTSIAILLGASSLAEASIAGEIVNRTLVTTVKRSGTGLQQPALPDMDLFGGDAVITEDRGWAAILLSDETMVQVNRNTVFVLKEVAPTAQWFKPAGKSPPKRSSPGRSFYRLDRGEAWFRNKNRDMLIHIETPMVTAGIRGTEINMTVAPDNVVTIAVIEGEAVAENRFGGITGKAGELITVHPGRAPVKRLLLKPGDAVQWTVTIPPGLDSYLKKEAAAAPGLPDLVRLRRMIDAQVQLEQRVTQGTADPSDWAWLALVRLYRGKTREALQAARKAVILDPDSLTARIVLSYCFQGVFDLASAMAVLETVLEQDPGHVLALTNMAKLLFASNRTVEARSLIDRAAGLAPDHPDVLTLKGFLALAMQDYPQVEPAFRQAIKSNPQVAEAFMGLAIYHMRQGKTDIAFKEIAGAVLLEPRRSVFASYWAKMLYQVRRFDRALELLDLAQDLDPNDPTPHLYRAIIFRDLNRSGEAVAQLNRAIELNDNRAVYRSRFLLDQDQAVKNVNLSIIHNQLGLSKWAESQALESIKTDYRNASGHTYLGGALLNMEDRLVAGAGEQLLGLLLAPANLNTMNTFEEYTSFFEQPDLSVNFIGTAGNMDTWESSIFLLGAVPEHNFAYKLIGSSSSTERWRETNGRRIEAIIGSFKWDLSPRDSLLLTLSDFESHHRDRLTRRYEYDASPLTGNGTWNHSKSIQAGYHRKLSPRTDLILLGRYLHYSPDLISTSYFRNEDLGMIVVVNGQESSTKDDYTFQAHVLHTAQDHEIIAGALFQRFRQDTDLDEVWDHYFEFEDTYIWLYSDYITINGQKTDRFASVYLQDIWEASPLVTVEAGLYLDMIRTQSIYTTAELEDEMINPRFGVIFRPSDTDRFRLAAFRYVVPNTMERIDPIDVAGVPVYRSAVVGSVTKEADLVWEHEWKKAFSSIGVFCFESDIESLDRQGFVLKDRARVKGAEQELNILALDWAGIAAGYRFMDIENDTAPQKDRKEHQAFVSITCNHPTGLFGSLCQTFRYLDMDIHTIYDDEKIWVTDASVGYRFPDKRGRITLAVNNIFNRHFNWITDDVIYTGRIPEREILLTLSLVF